VDFLYRYLPHAVCRAMSTLVDGVRIAFLGYCVWLTYLLIDKIGTSRMSIVDLPMGLVYGVVLFGFALMAWRSVGVAIGNWRRGASVLERPELLDEAR
jgi:TRAP-type C4-dicarboxylate transport system permease small subunit